MAKANEKTGILLVNTGSPDTPEIPAVRAYLRQFLADPRVIDLAPIPKWLLLNLVILPFRPKVSAHAYRQIWTDGGSPLIANTRALSNALAEALPEMETEIGMAYGTPSIETGLERLIERGARRFILAPLFPQYASATTGSVLEAAYRTLGARTNVPALSVMGPFYDDPGFLDAWAALSAPQLEAFRPDHLLMSFHGLPERHLLKSDPTGRHCLKSPDCCQAYRGANPDCYRAHCFATAHGIADRLGLDGEDYTVSFQSRLGRDAWLAPATGEVLVLKARKGVKRLAVLSPSFVADCLETLEELGIRGKESFLGNGGEAFHLLDSLNGHPAWVKALSTLIRHL